VRVLQYGYGGQGKRHQEAWFNLNIQPILVDPFCDVPHQIASGIEGIYQVNPDIVTIATPASTHYQLISVAFKAGVKTIFCEKPLSPFLSDVEALIYEKPKDTQVFVGYGYRFVPGIKRMAEHIHEKGPPLYIKAQLTALKRARSDVNVLWADGSHLFDLLKYIGIGIPTSRGVSGNSTDKTYNGSFKYLLNDSDSGIGLAVIEANSISAGTSIDPHVETARGTKRLEVLHSDYTLEVVDFSSHNAVDLLEKQFQMLLDGKTSELHTLEESLDLTRFLRELI